MDLHEQLDVRGSGAVVLGPGVTCDGFHADRDIRVQSHVHLDHMRDFSTSLGGEVFMTRPTRELLDHRFPALEYASNVHLLEYGERWKGENVEIELVSSNHMIGAAQVKVTLDGGVTLGYSGDFGWPLENVIQVDGLVVDATYGKPSLRGDYSQQRVQEAFCELVIESLTEGPVHLLADTGPAERGLQLLMMQDVIGTTRVVGSERSGVSAAVHRRYGYQLPDILVEGSAAATDALRDGHYVRLWSLHSREINDGLSPGTVIRLTKFGAGNEPIRCHGEGSYTVGFSNHADFGGTMDYVAKTGASVVVTDDVRGKEGGRAQHLASAIRSELRVEAYTSTNYSSRAWGA